MTRRSDATELAADLTSATVGLWRPSADRVSIVLSEGHDTVSVSMPLADVRHMWGQLGDALQVWDHPTPAGDESDG